MTDLLSCPPEIRQHILSYLLPEEVRAFKSVSRTSALLPVILTCKTLEGDILQLFHKWSPKFRLDRPQDVAEVSESAEASHIQTLVLRLFAETETRRLHEPRSWVGGLQEMMPWIERVSVLPKFSVRTVILDLTPAPMWMVRKRPDCMRAMVMDGQCKLFFDYMGPAIERLIETIHDEYDGRVSIQIGGTVGWNCRQPIFRLIDEAEARHRKKIQFVGDWLSGDTQNPVHLSLPLISCRLGIPREEDVENIGRARRRQSFRDIVKLGDRTENPTLDLETLGPVPWSKDSTTLYYANAQDDEEDAQKTLIQILNFALEKRHGSTNDSLDFAPATKSKRRLIHRLAEDLDLGSESIGDASQKFVRVSCRPTHSPKSNVHLKGNFCQYRQERQAMSLLVVDSPLESGSCKIRLSISAILQKIPGTLRDWTAKVRTAALRILGLGRPNA